MRRQTTITDYFSSKQLLLFAFAGKMQGQCRLHCAGIDPTPVQRLNVCNGGYNYLIIGNILKNRLIIVTEILFICISTPHSPLKWINDYYYYYLTHADLKLPQCHQRWPNVKPTFDRRLVLTASEWIYMYYIYSNNTHLVDIGLQVYNYSCTCICELNSDNIWDII